MSVLNASLRLLLSNASVPRVFEPVPPILVLKYVRYIGAPSLKPLSRGSISMKSSSCLLLFGVVLVSECVELPPSLEPVLSILSALLLFGSKVV